MPHTSFKPTKGKPRSLDRYEGKWVAFVGERVVGTADSLASLMRALKKQKPHVQPSVLLVPRKDEGPYVLL